MADVSVSTVWRFCCKGCGQSYWESNNTSPRQRLEINIKCACLMMRVGSRSISAADFEWRPGFKVH